MDQEKTVRALRALIARMRRGDGRFDGQALWILEILGEATSIDVVTLVDGPECAVSADVKEYLREYAEERRPRGDFLTACLSNNLMNAVCRADANNLAQLREIMQYIYCELPSECWGNREKVDKWLKRSAVGTGS